MKLIRLVALILTVVCVCVMVPSCAEVTTYHNVRFAAIYEIPTEVVNENGEKEVVFEEEVLVDVIQAEITGSSDEMTSVLDAVIQILETNDIKHKVEEGGGITSIKGKNETTRGGYYYVWEYKINGSEPKDRAGNIPVEDDMKIVYYYKAAKDTSSAATDTTTEAE